MDFHGLDLNLLVAFDALMIERNVTRAAVHVGVSQPAMSAALSRLRKRFGDSLFLRGADGLTPTPRARELAAPISQALHQLEDTLIEDPRFVPDEAEVTFTLGLPEHLVLVLLPLLARTLEGQAPNVSLNVHGYSDRNQVVDLLDSGIIDAAVGVSPDGQDARIRTQPLLKDDFVTILRRDHPLASQAMSRANFLALSHVLVSPEGDRHGIVDRRLAQQGQQRTLALTVSDMASVPSVVAQTRLSATLLKRAVLYSAARNQVILFPPPVDLPTVRFKLIWHRRHDAHPAQQWFRQTIMELAGSL